MKRDRTDVRTSIDMAMKTVIRRIGTALAAAGFAWFAIPVPLGMLNIGNISGMAACGLLTYFGLVPLKTQGVPKASNTKKSAYQSSLAEERAGLIEEQRSEGSTFTQVRRILRTTISAFLTIAFSLAAVMSCLMISAALRKPAQDATAVVLGCRVYGEKPSLMLVKRLEAAEQYLVEHPQARCIVSGGKGPGEDISEAECMYRYLTSKGISADRIYKEEKSQSTRENLAFSAEILKQQGLPLTVAVVTDGFHEYRGCREAAHAGLTYGAAPAKTPWWLLATFTVREYYGILYSWLH